MDINLQVPIWTIEHVAAALHTSVDNAREYTYSADFPAPKAPFAKNLWEREAVLVWFAGLPTRDRRTTRATKSTTKDAHLDLAMATRTVRTPRARTSDSYIDDRSEASLKPAIKSYKPRSPR